MKLQPLRLYFQLDNENITKGEKKSILNIKNINVHRKSQMMKYLAVTHVILIGRVHGSRLDLKSI
jgi:hypothetical protein